MSQVTKDPSETDAAAQSIDQIDAALLVVARSMNQPRLHEYLLQSAGVRLDRAGAALLHKLYLHGNPLRVTTLADLLGIDAPNVTRKIQQLEREQLVSRRPDPDDRRATRIMVTEAGRHALERLLEARREWYDRLLDGWDEAELAAFASLLGKFSSALAHDLEEARVD